MASLDLTNPDFVTYESALTIFGRLTGCEGEAIKVLIDKGLLDRLADTLKM